MAVYFSDNCGSLLFLFKLFSLLTYELFKPALWPLGSDSQVGKAQAQWCRRQGDHLGRSGGRRTRE